MCVSGGWGAAGVHRSQAVVPEGHPVVYSILFCFLALTQSLTESGGPQASTIPLPPLPPAGVTLDFSQVCLHPHSDS